MDTRGNEGREEWHAVGAWLVVEAEQDVALLFMERYSDVKR